MARGGAREGGGRPKIDKDSESLRISIRLPEKIIKEIEGLGTGKNLSEKLRNIIEIGIENLEKKQEK